MFCDVTSLYPNRLWNTRDVGLLFISTMLTSVRALCGFMRNFVFACLQMQMKWCQTCTFLHDCVCVSWLCPLEFPENADHVHLVATYLIVTPCPRYSTQSPQPVSPLPFYTSLFCCAFFYCSILFLRTCISLEQLCWLCLFIELLCNWAVGTNTFFSWLWWNCKLQLESSFFFNSWRKITG